MTANASSETVDPAEVAAAIAANPALAGQIVSAVSDVATDSEVASAVASVPMLPEFPAGFYVGPNGPSANAANIVDRITFAPIGSIVLVRGDDYAAADGRALRFSSPAWPTLTGSAIKFRTKRRGAGATVLEVSASLTAPAIVDVALTASQTDLKPGTYTYEVEATLSGRKITLALGKLVVKGDVR